ncbi:pantothenate kinase [Leptolyngbya sp. FACHB-36]|nr:pantothenate kinase [Leptolyngbya sp. FACHB-36]MBD2022381.1 pantothenate kinase [Leptolyngbya sp. FACHB-36]
MWLALAIGNSRLHWAQFHGSTLQHTWNTPHLSAEAVQHLIHFGFTPDSLRSLERSHPSPTPDLVIASVVPAQAALWQQYPYAHFLSLDDVPLTGMYPTLGLDRALAVWGAIVTIGAPVLVIDAGTALTFTGANAEHQLVGGAILPGLRLQFQSLGQSTAALPELDPTIAAPLPPRWAQTTETAIASGVLHTVLAGIESFIRNWWQQFPTSAVVLTGGDGDRLYAYLTQLQPDLVPHLTYVSPLITQGICAIRAARRAARSNQTAPE